MRAARAAIKKRNHVWRVKIISLGDQSVGKSCLIKRYCEGKFVSKYIPTIGVDYGVKPVKCTPFEVRINFFDMAGPQDYTEIRNEFYSDAQACLLVYDVCDKRSFQNLGAWVDELHTHCKSGMATFVVANKIDRQRQVSRGDGEHWAASQGFNFAEVSAKSGEGVDALFAKLLLGALQAWQGVPPELLTVVETQAGDDAKGRLLIG